MLLVKYRAQIRLETREQWPRQTLRMYRLYSKYTYG